MKKFLLTRLVGLVIVLLTMTAVIFLLRQVVPSDPARSAVGPNAPVSVLEAKRAELGLDDPLITQYAHYLGQLAHGDLGESLRTHRAVRSDITDTLPASIELAVAAALIALLIGPGIAILETLARRPGPLRYVLAAATSAPIFLTALLLLYGLWFRLHLLPGSGRTNFADAPSGPTGLLTVDAVLAGRWLVAWDAVQHLALPALALALPMAAAVGRSLRSSLIGVLRQDYVRTARSKGMSEREVLRKHGLRNASTAPLAMAGLQVGLIFGNLLVVERIFSWPGAGNYTVQAIGADDLTAVLGCSLLFGAIYIVVNTLVDLAQAWVDPRVTLN